MSDTVIVVENLGKCYRIGQLEPYKTLRDTLVNAVSAPARAAVSVLKRRQNSISDSASNSHIWALRNVSFKIQQGEVVGVIGRNGAGKTTLLKILTRVTNPTEGYAEIRGRVGSLLEVNTGLGHHELTGRENIYLMGATLGMRKAEINRKFTEIVEFSGVEKFLDTPIKRYSAGMRMRLVFSVAAHLEPEILLVDEVLAVGDVAFQKKCLGKMEDVARGGRTVLFVSHDMGAIQNLCTRCILIENGRIKNTGKTSDIINEYLSTSLAISNTPLIERINEQKKDAELIYTGIEFQNSKGERLNHLSAGEDTSIILNYRCKNKQKLKDIKFIYMIKKMGEPLIILSTEFFKNFEVIATEGRVICNIPKLPLMPGYYSLYIRSYSNNVIVNELEDAVTFYVKEGSFFDNGLLPQDSEAKTLINHSWELTEVDN